MILQLAELFFVELRQRGRRNIEAHMNRRRDFIDVLPTRTLRTHRMDVDLCIRDSHVRRDEQHQGEGKVGSESIFSEMFRAWLSPLLERKMDPDPIFPRFPLPLSL